MVVLVTLFFRFLFKNHYNHYNLSYSFLFLYIMNKIDPDKALGDVSPTVFVNYIISIFTLSLIAVLSLFSVIYLLICVYLFYTYNIEEKFKNYPRIIKMIKFANNMNKI
jgi:hypothetical protein